MSELSQADQDVVLLIQKLVDNGQAMGFGKLSGRCDFRYTLTIPGHDPIELVRTEYFEADVRNGRLMNCHISRLPRYSLEDVKKFPGTKEPGRMGA